MSGVSKLTADRNQRILLDLVSKPGNDVCADCKARAPRWASHNLGIFICMNCASIHRKIGTHITKVKSVTMDSWSREQVEVMKSIGNIASNAKYNPNEARNPPPANREESERDSELEKFIRWKYEFKRFMDKSSNQPSPSVSAFPPRAHSTPAATIARQTSPLPPLPTKQTSYQPPPSRAPESRPYSAIATTSAPSHPQASTAPPTVSLSVPQVPPPVPPQPPNPPLSHPVWNDMMSLSTQSISPMAPQSQLHSTQPQFQQTSFTSPSNTANSFGAPSATNPFPSNFITQLPARPPSLPVPTGVGSSFQTHNQQQQPFMGNPFAMPQQPIGFPGQMNMTGTSFQSTPSGAMQVQSPFGQPQSSQSPFSHSYTPPSSFPQQQQQFAPSSFPQQFAQPSHSPMQQPQQGFAQQPPTQGNPFGAPMQWQQQQTGFSEQPQYGQWGGM